MPPEPPEASAEAQTVLAAFVADFNAAAEGGDVDWLYDHLAPPVVEVFGETACRDHLAAVTVEVESLTMGAPARGPVARHVEVPTPDGRTLAFDLQDLYFADISFIHDGDTIRQTGWVQLTPGLQPAYFVKCA